MSRTAIIDVTVKGHDAGRVREIVEAARAVWPFGGPDAGEALELSGELGSLHEPAAEAAGRLNEAIRAANGAPCHVRVTVTDMEGVSDVEEAEGETFDFPAPAVGPEFADTLEGRLQEFIRTEVERVYPGLDDRQVAELAASAEDHIRRWIQEDKRRSRSAAASD